MKKKLILMFFIFLEIYLLFNSKEIINDFSKTINLCLYNLMPTMFFSILFSQILIKLEFEKYIPKFIIHFLSRILNINNKEVIIFILSMISGYPNNAKMLNGNKNLDKLINYTSFINPIFLIGTVGNIYLKNIKITLIIYLSHIISNIIIGIIYRNKKNYIKNNNKSEKYNISSIYFNCLNITNKSLVNIFSNILAFSIIITLLKDLLPFSTTINYFIIGIFEFSTGIFLISTLKANLFIKGLLITIIICFSSFSIHFQTISLNEKIKYTKFLLNRLLGSLLGILVYFMLNILLIH